MPAVSKRQFRWMWATDQPFAERWATRGRYRRLPATKADGALTPGSLSPSERARIAALARWKKPGAALQRREPAPRDDAINLSGALEGRPGKGGGGGRRKGKADKQPAQRRLGRLRDAGERERPIDGRGALVRVEGKMGDDWLKHGSHNQASHGRRTARRRASQNAYRQARAEGASVSDARAKAKEAGLAKQSERDARLKRMQERAGGAMAAPAAAQPRSRAERLKAEREAFPKPPARGESVTVTTPEGNTIHARTAMNGDTSYTVNNGRTFQTRDAARREAERQSAARIQAESPRYQAQQRRETAANERRASEQRRARDAEDARRANVAEQRAVRRRMWRLQDKADRTPAEERELARLRTKYATLTDATKAGARHSRGDTDIIKAAYSKAMGIMDDMKALGYTDQDGDGMPDPPDGIKALDYGTICDLVCEAVCEALEDVGEMGDDDEAPTMPLYQPKYGDDDDEGDDEPHVMVYPGFAIAALDDGRTLQIPYTLDGYDVTIADPSEWALVEADWSEVDDYTPPEDDEGDGMAVKMLGDGRIGAYAVRFGSEEEPDLSPMRDFFTKSTDFWLEQWQTRPMLYHHAQEEATRDAPVVGLWTKARVDDVGVWLEGELNKAHQYHAAIKEMVKRGALRLSSDSAPHLVQREPRQNGTNWVKRWPMLAASLTPTPAEPRLLPAGAIKAAFDAAGLTPPDELIATTAEAQPSGDARGGLLAAEAPTSDRARMLALKSRLLTLTIKEISQ